MRGIRLLFLASWVILLVLSGLLIFLSLNSLRLAYFGKGDTLVAITEGDQVRVVGLEKIREIAGEEGVKAFKARRATAATWAFGCAVLSALVTFFPYRRGEKWAWWALLLALGLSQLLSLGRAVTIGTIQGASASGIILAFALLGLIAGIPHIFSKPFIAGDDVE